MTRLLGRRPTSPPAGKGDQREDGDSRRGQQTDLKRGRPKQHNSGQQQRELG
jgi:hypothetical protein